MRRVVQCILGIGLFLATTTTSTIAQPWDLYEDPISGETCDLVNAQNAELVVLSESGELVIISDADLILGGSFVDLDGNVFFAGGLFGVIAFATDGDGFRSLWWLTEGGTVMAIDPGTLFPFDSLTFPEEYVGVECDACSFWDVPEDCAVIIIEDSDDDGVLDGDDLCPDTFPGEAVDFGGCSCEDLGNCDCFIDTDDDGIENCDDQCPNSPFNADVDIDGCTIVAPVPIVVGCGNVGALMLGLTFTGLFMMRFSGRRNW